MLDLPARMLLSPLLAAQAVGVRRRALCLPEPEGPRTGRTGAGPPLSLLIIGDSSAAGVGVARQQDALSGQLTRRLAQRFDLRWRLQARTGATTGSTLADLATAKPEPFDVIITALGVNDVTRLLPYPLWLRRQRALLERLRLLYGPRRIYVSGVPPVGSFPLLPDPLRWTLGRQALRFDQGLAALLHGTSDAVHVPFDLPMDPSLMAEDGFHPSARLYAVWGERKASRIVSDWL